MGERSALLSGGRQETEKGELFSYSHGPVLGKRQMEIEGPAVYSLKTILSAPLGKVLSSLVGANCFHHLSFCKNRYGL